MANPANYQRTGTEPIRSNQNVKQSTSLTTGLKASGTPSGGTKNLRAYQATKQSMNLTKPAGSNKKAWPGKVASYTDSET